MRDSISTQPELVFNDLSPDDFERLAHFILEDSDEYFNVARYGGVRDRGRDVIAYKLINNTTSMILFIVGSVFSVVTLKKIFIPSASAERIPPLFLARARKQAVEF